MPADMVMVADAVENILENSGVLNSLRANLRSNVLAVIKGEFKTKTAAKAFATTELGNECIALLKDFLTVLNLNDTLSIFEAEIGSSSICKDRDGLISELRIQGHMSGVPLIATLVSAKKQKDSLSTASEDGALRNEEIKSSIISEEPRGSTVVNKLSQARITRFAPPVKNDEDIEDSSYGEDFEEDSKQNHESSPAYDAEEDRQSTNEVLKKGWAESVETRNLSLSRSVSGALPSLPKSFDEDNDDYAFAPSTDEETAPKGWIQNVSLPDKKKSQTMKAKNRGFFGESESDEENASNDVEQVNDFEIEDNISVASQDEDSDHFNLGTGAASDSDSFSLSGGDKKGGKTIMFQKNTHYSGVAVDSDLDFSMSEQEVDFAVNRERNYDYAASALPPSVRR